MELINIIKKTALEAVDASQPCNVLFGTVTSTSPLQVNVNQKLILTSEFLVLTKAVQDYEVDIEVSHYVEDDTFDESHTHKFTGTDSNGDTFSETTKDTSNLDGTHNHKYKGIKKIKIYNGLKSGEKVILIKIKGGQKYVILDRISNHQTNGEWI